MIYRALTTTEDARFRSWARANYEPGSPVVGVWHPVVQEECARINRERATFIAEPAADA